MSPTPAPLTARRRPSRAEVTDRLLAAARQILSKEGYAALTMERVAALSGCAKTTLYRHWPTKAALCMELYLGMASRELRDPETGNIFDDLRLIVESVIRLQTRTVAGAAFVGLITEAHAKPETHPAFKKFAAQRREITGRVLKRALARGELREGTDIDLVIDALGGAVTFRLLQRHAPLDANFASALVRLVLRGCAQSSAVTSDEARWMQKITSSSR
jgi:AcrR family transcriptional regulator